MMSFYIRCRLAAAAPLLLLAVGCAGANSNNTAAPSATSGGSAESPAATGVGRPDQIDADAPEEFTETASGLKYRILRKSDGPKPNAFNYVLAHYRGWTDENGEFDSSYQRGEATGFPLDGVIAGWTEGLQLIGEGGMIELEIPAELGYGQNPPPGSGIPPGATLHFVVELEKVQ